MWEVEIVVGHIFADFFVDAVCDEINLRVRGKVEEHCKIKQEEQLKKQTEEAFNSYLLTHTDTILGKSKFLDYIKKDHVIQKIVERACNQNFEELLDDQKYIHNIAEKCRNTMNMGNDYEVCSIEDQLVIQELFALLLNYSKSHAYEHSTTPTKQDLHQGLTAVQSSIDGTGKTIAKAVQDIQGDVHAIVDRLQTSEGKEENQQTIKKFEIPRPQRIDPVLYLFDWDEAPLDVAALYMPPAANRFLTESEKKNIKGSNQEILNDGDQEYAEKQIISAEIFTQDLLKNHYTVITGEAGLGKTTFLKALYNGFVEQYRPDVDSVYPMFVSFKELNQLAENQGTYSISRLLECRYDISRDKLAYLIHTTQVLLLVDGLDEIQVEDADRLLSNMNELQNCKIIFTSRPRGAGGRVLKIGTQEVRRYELCMMTEELFKSYTANLLHVISRNAVNDKIKSIAKNPVILENYCAAVRQQETLQPDYCQITRVPFYSFPLISYYLHYLSLPKNSISLLDYFTTQMLEWDMIKKKVYGPILEPIKYVLGVLAIRSYRNYAKNGRPLFYDTIEINTAIQCAKQYFGHDVEEKLGRYMKRNQCPYFSKGIGFIHDVYKAYSAAYLWWICNQNSAQLPGALDLSAFLLAGTMCEKAVEAILSYVDLQSENNPELIIKIIDVTQKATESPNYEVICRSVSRFAYNRSAVEQHLLSDMFRRGICGIHNYNSKNNSCTHGANPYDELFYFAARYKYRDAVIQYQKQGQTDEEKYIETVLLHDLYTMFQIGEIPIDRSNSLYQIMLAASSVKRGLRGYIHGHINLATTPCCDFSFFSSKNIIVSINVLKECSDFNFEPLKRLPDVYYLNVENGNTVYQSIGNCIIETKERILVKGGNQSIMVPGS